MERSIIRGIIIQKNYIKNTAGGHSQTLRHLRGERTGDGDEGVVSAPVVYRHLFALTEVFYVSVALVTELIETKSSIH